MTENSEHTAPATAPAMTMRQARMLDLRSWICALFAIFGVVVTILGLTASEATIDQAAGINIDLWTGAAMLCLSIGMGLWAWRKPPIPVEHVAELPEQPDRP